jgi:dynein light intermediate chain 1, cytosolic
MLSNASAAFAPLLTPLFTAKKVPHTLVTILLDWEDPFRWPAQLRQWIRVLGTVVEGLDGEVKAAMNEVMKAWREKRVGVVAEGVPGRSGSVSGDSMTTADVLPLGPGEWEDGLGVPLSVVCLNAEKQERMEKEYGWQEGDFDFVLQWMRCMLLKREWASFQDKCRH